MADFQAVIAVLRDAPAPAGGAPEASGVQSARALLCDALPYAVAPYAKGEEPHAFQQALLEHVRKTFGEDRTAAEAEARAVDAEVAAAQASLEEAGKEEAGAAQKIEEAAAAAEAKRAELGAANARVQDADSQHARTVATTALVLDKQAKLLEDRRKLQDVAAAIEATGSGEAPRAVEVVTGFLEEHQAEKPLIAAAPNAFGLPASARSAFDNMVVEEVSKMVADKSAALDAAVSAGAEDAAFAEAERLGAWAVHDVEKERAAGAAAVHGAALADLEGAKMESRSLKAKVEGCRSSASAALVKQTLVELRVQSVDKALGALARLMTPPAAEAAEPAAPAADVAMAGATAAAEAAEAPAKDVAMAAAEPADLASAGA